MRKLLFVFLLATLLPQIAFAADQSQYQWQGALLSPTQKVNGQWESCTAPGNRCSKGVYTSPSTYPTSGACYSALSSATDKAYTPPKPLTVPETLQFTCSCDSPISGQPSCPGYQAPPVAKPSPAPTSNGNPSNNSKFQFQPIVSIPLATGEGSVTGKTALACYLNSVFQIAIAVSVVLAVIMIVIDGFKYMTSEAVGGKKDALGGIRSAIFGLILLLSSWLILNIINPQILSLSLFGKVESCDSTPDDLMPFLVQPEAPVVAPVINIGEGNWCYENTDGGKVCAGMYSQCSELLQSPDYARYATPGAVCSIPIP